MNRSAPPRGPPEVMTSSQATSDALNEVFHALSHPTRRHILVSLHALEAESDEIIPLDAVVPPEPDVNLQITELVHIHLPKLVEPGYAEWNGDSAISRGPNFPEIAPVIQALHEHQHQLPGSWP